MQTILGDIVSILEAGKAFALATILRSEGSSPRGTGACMLVTQDGAQKGTIGGGAVEYAAAKHALEVLGTGASGTELYRLNPNEIADLGMICGGRVWVLFQRILPEEATLSLFRRLKDAADKGEPAYLVRRLENGGVTDTGAYLEDGLLFSAAIDETSVRENTSSRPALVDAGEGQLLIEPVTKPGMVYLFGGGHVAQKLVPLLAYVDFRVTVCEDRPDFADKALFPEAERTVLCDFTDIADKVTIRSDDSVVIMTRGHRADYEILRQVLKTEANYIGCIGSRHKIAMTRQRLIEDGFTDADFARVYTPIGIPILAETPEEIGISVVAQMIQHRAERACALQGKTVSAEIIVKD